MSRFNADAYDKLFPREVETENIETVVETFTPTKDILEGKEVDDVNISEAQEEENNGECTDDN